MYASAVNILGVIPGEPTIHPVGQTSADGLASTSSRNDTIDSAHDIGQRELQCSGKLL